MNQTFVASYIVISPYSDSRTFDCIYFAKKNQIQEKPMWASKQISRFIIHISVPICEVKTIGIFYWDEEIQSKVWE